MLTGVLTGVATLTAVSMSFEYAARSRRSQLWGPGFYRGRQGKQQIALTFDDGPSRATPRVLELLARHEIRATFFCCGFNVERLPEVASAAHDAGHVIANHTYSHPTLLYLPAKQVREEIAKTQQAIENAVGSTPYLFRPPFGVRAPSMRKILPELGLTNVMWTVSGQDWKSQKEKIVNIVLEGSSDGGIIDLHDGRETNIADPCEEMVRALTEIIPCLRDQGFSFVTAGQMLEEWRGRSAKAAPA